MKNRVFIGTTPIAKSICNRKDMNSNERHNQDFIVKARPLWMRGGCHLRTDDLRQSK